jgi:ATP-dependent DNA helicase DinG
MHDSPHSPLLTDVRAFFAPDGPLALRQPGYRPRLGQQTMAEAVAQTIDARSCLVVEAGTGVGKTYAYLVPALLSGRRVLLSTATKALQDQLYGRDLPAVAQALGLPLKTALLKGRSSYLCLHRLEQAPQRLPPGDRYLPQQLRRIQTWATATQTGDLAEVVGLDDRSELIPWVTSTRDNCLGSQCPQFRACHVNQARREALAADVVVVNHHLFFADWNVRESGMAELLPTVDVLVFDEAHQLLPTSVQFLGHAVASGQLLDWMRDSLAQGLQAARGLKDWSALCSTLERAVRDLRLDLQPTGRFNQSGVKLRWAGNAPEGVDPALWQQGWDTLLGGLQALLAALEEMTELTPEFARLFERGQALHNRLLQIGLPADSAPPFARWVELGAQFRLVLAPLDVSAAFRARLFESEDSAGKSWVFTSATLGADATLSWFTRPLGLADVARTVQVESPFDYGHQASLYVPAGLPKPAEAGHAESLARTLWPWAVKLSGRTLVLTTTLRSLRTISETLRQLSEAELGPDVLAQGSAPKRELLARFRDAAHGGPGAVLVASASFWEGVDLPGDCLQLVVIDKLPFPPPDDPWVEARSKALQAEGQSPFQSYFLPEAAVALKQGAGRLIRSETDRGILVLGDVRLATMGYGRALLRSLPPMQRLNGQADLEDALQQLLVQRQLEDWVTRSSTRDQIPARTPD